MSVYKILEVEYCKIWLNSGASGYGKSDGFAVLSNFGGIDIAFPNDKEIPLQAKVRNKMPSGD